MKKNIIYFSLLGLLCGLFALAPLPAQALTLGTNITIYDNLSSNGDWYTNREDQEVEPDQSTGQEWDLEGFFQQGKTMTMVGGWDFVNGFGQGRGTIWSGDLFIDVTGDAMYGQAISSSGSDTLVKNTFGYDYVYVLDFDNKSYNLYKINDQSMVWLVGFASNAGSNPYGYEEEGGGGTLLSSGLFEYISGLSNADVGLEGGSHNAVILDLSDLAKYLGEDVTFTAHFTMGCGNDNLMGQGHLVPLPSTLVLFATSLVGLGLLAGRKTWPWKKG